MDVCSFRADSRGFSLLEVLIAITILVLTALVAFPLLGGSLKQWRSRQFARSVLSAHRTARTQSMNLQRRIQIRYDMDRELLRFWICTRSDSTGTCGEGDWRRFKNMPPLQADSENVDIWSVGHRKNGQACLIFLPSGYVYPPRRATPGNRKCSGEHVGSGVHITWKPPPTDGDSFSPCDWETIYTLGIGNGRSFLLSYGAYPSEPRRGSGSTSNDPTRAVSFHPWNMGTPPDCAYDQHRASGWGSGDG